ncbi:putative fatty acid/phospholipid synthesis protein PlsX [Candidatus Protochlamydia naegleriophila]|uniref:Phosphate acyltransferase n=2 Tax=Candidatus Protochlamydia naegleriophila TaxID=389348 RepID=A0A0U5JAS1_9BACT|nr:putative fatty acid/phospholipid synthesis protein PlsX [Candidatus Protochlamydia naegleriophila]
MGSESSPITLFEAVVQATQELSNVIFVVFVTADVANFIRGNHLFAPHLCKLHSRIELYLISDVIEMEDEPVIAMREKKNSSLVVGLRLLKRRHLKGFVSAGNTGALIVGATLSLPLLPGVKRPALLATLPTEQGDVAVIDVGGNVSCKAHHLVQFAHMGAAYQRCCKGIERPRVGLLNIGVESKKGTSEVRHAYQKLQALQAESAYSHMQFVGNVEGRGVFQGLADVLVTDGFTGNVLLKTSEGVACFLLEQLQGALEGISTEQKEAVLRYLRYEFDYEEYSGAIICGIDSVVVKCHGKSSIQAMFNGIQGAVSLVKNEFINQLKHELAVLHRQLDKN